MYGLKIFVTYVLVGLTSLMSLFLFTTGSEMIGPFWTSVSGWVCVAVCVFGFYSVGTAVIKSSTPDYQPIISELPSILSDTQPNDSASMISVDSISSEQNERNVRPVSASYARSSNRLETLMSEDTPLGVQPEGFCSQFRNGCQAGLLAALNQSHRQARQRPLTPTMNTVQRDSESDDQTPVIESQSGFEGSDTKKPGHRKVILE